MLMADDAGSVHLVNRGAEQLFDYSRDELVGQSVENLLPAERRQEHRALRAAFHAAPAARPMGLGRDLRGRRKDGREIPVEIGLNPLIVDGKAFVVASIVDISARNEAEQRMQFVMRELTHRSKNLLAVIQAIARRTAATSADMQAFNSNFGERLRGLAKSHDLLVERNWEGALIDDLVRSQFALLEGSEAERIMTQGPAMMLVPQAAQYLGLGLHELATNAAKYGALAVPTGQVQVTWQEDGGRFILIWRESGGSVMTPPDRKGFGRVILEEVVPGMLGGNATAAFDAKGMSWTLNVPLGKIVTTNSQPLQELNARNSVHG